MNERVRTATRVKEGPLARPPRSARHYSALASVEVEPSEAERVTPPSSSTAPATGSLPHEQAPAAGGHGLGTHGSLPQAATPSKARAISDAVRHPMLSPAEQIAYQAAGRSVLA
jgi:hypothetical protein